MSTPGLSCDRARRLFDDYLEYRLGKRDRLRVENHIAHCPRCTKELRARPALEHQLRLTLGTSVQSLCLSPDAGARIIRAAQGSVRRGIWLNRAMVGGRALAGALSVLLLLAGLVYLLNRAVLPWIDEPLSSAKVTQLPPSSTQPIAPGPSDMVRDALLEPSELYPSESLIPSQAGQGEQSQPLTYALVLEPGLLRTGHAFTTTVLIRNEQEQPLTVSQVNLDIEGPQHNYHFELAVTDPLPADSLSALRITPDSLAEASRERYQVSPDQIINVPGVYTIRVTLFHAAPVPSGTSVPVR